MRYGQQILLPKVAQVLVDVLGGVGPSGSFAEEDDLFQRRTAHAVVVFEVLAAHRVVDLHAAVFAGLDFVYEMQVSCEQIFPGEALDVADAQAHRAGDDAEQGPAVFAVAFQVLDQRVVVGAFERLRGRGYSFCCHDDCDFEGKMIAFNLYPGHTD